MTDYTSPAQPTEPANGRRRGAAEPHDTEELLPLIQAGLKLIPLHRPDDRSADGGQLGKAPLDKRWTTRDYSDFDAVAHMQAGGNVGVRLDGLIVADDDPRNHADGDDPAERLLEEGLLDPDAPQVETGGNGRHFYMRLPSGLDASDLRKKLDGYAGVDFKSGPGSQVVAPGSVHPETGNRYAHDFLRADWDEIPEAPAALIDALLRRPADDRRSASSSGTVDPDLLNTALDGLDPADFRDYDRWLRLMMACHHAMGGAGREAFIEWSTQDPPYADQADEIRKKWSGLDSGRPDAVTAGTLVRELRQAGRDDLAALILKGDPEADFADRFPAATDRGTDAPCGKAPMELAEGFLDGRDILRWRGDWLEYLQGAYRTIDDEVMEGKAWCWLDRRPVRDRGDVKPLHPTKSLVDNVCEAAKARVQAECVQPSWLQPREDDPAPTDIIAMRNGLLDLRERRLLPPTPRFFTRNALDFDFDPEPPRAAAWLKFLADIWPTEGELDNVETLQEIMGYLLTQDTSQQKMFLLVTPPRGGKGTINRVIQSLLGEGNWCAPSASDLASSFGLQGLMGRQLATITDMRLGKRSDPTLLSETLLRISGEDSVSVQRKYRDDWVGQLSTRFLFLTNELPQMRDVSGALASRYIVLSGKQSFLGKEDPGLLQKLKAELPSILVWALDGLERLRNRGYFVQPESSVAELRVMSRLGSPVKAFVEERCEVAPDAECDKDGLHTAFESWCWEEGFSYSGTKAHFFRDLNAAVAAPLTEAKLREGEGRRKVMRGIRLLNN